jgi:hypothetical protein
MLCSNVCNLVRLSWPLQDKVVAVAKFLRGKLAKALAHKQPLHTQVCELQLESAAGSHTSVLYSHSWAGWLACADATWLYLCCCVICAVPAVCAA